MTPYRERLRKFQKVLKENNIEGAIIRTLSTFQYFTGTKWLRPALLVPSEGEPVVIVTKNESVDFKRHSWIKEVWEYQNVERLMRLVREWIKNNGYKRIGLEFSVERDSYILFLEVFKRLNPDVEIKDIHAFIMEQRMIKEPLEIEKIEQAGQIAAIGREVAREIVKAGKTELEVAAEIVHELMLEGSESPQVYVSATPRLHAEPRKDVVIEEGQVVSVVIGADYEGYYVNTARSYPIGKVSKRVEKALEVMDIAFDIAISETKAGKKFSEIEKQIEMLYKANGFEEFYIKGYTHGVGLLIEETPITTIVVPHRFQTIKPHMVLAMVHAPLMLPEGAIKKECTVIITEEGLRIIT